MTTELKGSLKRFRITEATRINMRLILERSAESLAKVILLVGQSGAGKSSLAEHATNTTGDFGDEINPVTTSCEVLRKPINGTEYFFIDTPGFDDNISAVTTFEQVNLLLNTIRNHIDLVGIWYVADVTKQYTSLDALATKWVREFCGGRFCRYTAIVTTHWDAGLPLQELEHRCEHRQVMLKELLQNGAAMYKHGRVYEDGFETPEIIQWNPQGRTELIRQTKDMIMRRFRGFPISERRSIDELRSSTDIQSTDIQNTATGRRRMYMFQSPLSFLEAFQATSGSGSGVLPDPLTHWEDTTDLSETTSLPNISAAPFDFRCHLGIIVIHEAVCANALITLVQKLATGTIYEHSGPTMEHARCAVGRMADNALVRSFTALEFIGYTDSETEDLDALLQLLVSVHGIMHLKPLYQPIFWNCHDIACRFAFLAANPDQDLQLLRELSGTFERAKFLIPAMTMFGCQAFSTLPAVVLPTEMPALFLFPLLGQGVSRLAVSRAVSKRMMCADMLIQRFPRLENLNNVTSDEWRRFLQPTAIHWLSRWWTQY